MKNNRKTHHTTKSRFFNKFAETKNIFTVRTSKTTQAGVMIDSRGAKKGTVVEVILPSTTIHGSKRMVKVQLSGRQARALFDTLSRHYDK